MTTYQPRHRRLGLYARAARTWQDSALRTRLRRVLDGLSGYEEEELTDDNGEKLGDLFNEDERVFPRQGPPLKSPTGGAAVYPSLAAEDVPRPSAVESAQAGPGHFHDDAPAGAIPTVRVGDAYIPNLGYHPAELDDTIIDMRPEPRAGKPAWQQNRWPMPARDRTWVDDLVQRVMAAPIAEVRRALEAPDADAYLWNMAQRRAIAA